MAVSKKKIALSGVILGILAILFGLLKSGGRGEFSITINDNILKNFYTSNRNLEEPVFIDFEDLSDNQILSMRNEFIKREVLKREALGWGLDKVDPLILSRLAQLGEQTIINNLIEDDIDYKDLLDFYNNHKSLYTDDPRVTFSHIFFRKDQDKILEMLNQYSQNQDKEFFNNNLLTKVSMFPYQKNYSQKYQSFIAGHFSEETAGIIFSIAPSDKWQGPIESPFGYHLLRVSSLSNKEQRSFNDVRPLVRARVEKEKRKENLKLELEKRISQYKIIER